MKESSLLSTWPDSGQGSTKNCRARHRFSEDLAPPAPWPELLHRTSGDELGCSPAAGSPWEVSSLPESMLTWGQSRLQRLVFKGKYPFISVVAFLSVGDCF